MLFFVYASVVSEKEVILQTREMLLMGDNVMTDDLPGAALLPGGTERKAIPYDVTFLPRDRGSRHEEEEYSQTSRDVRPYREETYLHARTAPVRSGSLPPLRGRAVFDAADIPDIPRSPDHQIKFRPRSLSRYPKPNGILPKMSYDRPEVPLPPFRIHALPHALDEVGLYEVAPPMVGSMEVRRPLITTVSAAAETASMAPLTARPFVSTTESTQSAERPQPGRPPLMPHTAR